MADKRHDADHEQEGATTPPDAQPLTLRQRVFQMLEDGVNRLPYVPQLRIFAGDLQATREWWPLIVPLLLIIGLRSYRRERRDHLRRRLAEELLDAAERGDVHLVAARHRKRARSLLRPGK